jgi:hypothetical protein
MCLNVVTKYYPEDDISEGEGWKFFEGVDDISYCPPCFPINIYPNRWIKSKQKPVCIIYSLETYLSGFHVFKTKEDAEKHWLNKSGYHLKKIKYKGIICEGGEECSGSTLNCKEENNTQFSECLVVKEIYLSE